MRSLFVVLASLLAGCAVTASAPLAPVGDSHGVELKSVSASGPHLRKYRLTNRSPTRLHYLHWTGQGPEPVVYCRDEDNSERICSKAVYLEGDDSTGYSEWVHDTYLDSNESVSITANSGQAKLIGIKVFYGSAVRGGNGVVLSSNERT
jgi:hypothetical protein